MDGKLAKLEHIKPFLRLVYGNKQDRIKGTPGEILVIGNDGLLSSLGRDDLNAAIVPRKNILVNSRFERLFNQRGQTSYSAGAVVANAMDAWMVGNGTISLDSNKTAITQVQNNDNAVKRNVLFQRIDHPEMFAGQYLTFSCLIPEIGTSSDVGLSAWITGNKINTTTPNPERISTPGLLSLTFKVPETVLPTDDFRVYTLLSPSGIFRPKSAKLEVGENQTLAYKNQNGEWIEYEPTHFDYELERLRCMRHIVVGPNASNNCFGRVESNRQEATFIITTPVPMIGSPKVTIPALKFCVPGHTFDVTDVSVNGTVSSNSVYFRAPCDLTSVPAYSSITGFMPNGYTIES